MRHILNREMILSNQFTSIGSEVEHGNIPEEVHLEWEAWLQVHNFAADIGVLGRDEELHEILDSRLAWFEQGEWK